MTVELVRHSVRAGDGGSLFVTLSRYFQFQILYQKYPLIPFATAVISLQSVHVHKLFLACQRSSTTSPIIVRSLPPALFTWPLTSRKSLTTRRTGNRARGESNVSRRQESTTKTWINKSKLPHSGQSSKRTNESVEWQNVDASQHGRRCSSDVAVSFVSPL